MEGSLVKKIVGGPPSTHIFQLHINIYLNITCLRPIPTRNGHWIFGLRVNIGICSVSFGVT